MFDGYHFGSLKFYDEMITFGMGGVGWGWAMNLRIGQSRVTYMELVAAGLFGMRWDVRCEMRCDMRCEMRCDRPPITSRVCGELYLKSSIHVWAETFASVVGSI